MKKRITQLTFIAFLAFAVLLVGCTSTNSEGPGNDTPNAPEPDSGSREISLAYVAWDSEIASTHLIKYVLEDKLGYEVEMLQVDAGPMWAGVAGGSADAMVAAWLPSTHEHYYEEYEEGFQDLGVNLDGTRVGLVVPAYMDINSIEDLQNYDATDFIITGIEPGAGIMTATNEAIEAYELEEWSILESSSAGMAAELRRAIDNEEPVIVTGWTPHWKFADFDLKYLEDPLNVYGGDEQIHTIVRLGLEEDQPVAYSFLDRFNWTADDMAGVMIDILDGASPEEAAATWVDANEDTVNEWIEGLQ